MRGQVRDRKRVRVRGESLSKTLSMLVSSGRVSVRVRVRGRVRGEAFDVLGPLAVQLHGDGDMVLVGEPSAHALCPLDLHCRCESVQRVRVHPSRTFQRIPLPRVCPHHP